MSNPKEVLEYLEEQERLKHDCENTKQIDWKASYERLKNSLYGDCQFCYRSIKPCKSCSYKFDSARFEVTK